jgi:clan AA aspartic protease (TIGR02281 family)
MTVAEESAPAHLPPPVYTAQAPAPAPTYAAPPTRDDVPVLVGHNTVEAMVIVGGRSLDMLVDTGATNGSLPTEFADQLIRDGAATESEQEPFKMANGAIKTGRTIIVNTVMIGNHTIHDIRFGVGGDAPLLGLNALEAVSGSFKIDHDHGVLSFS